ncbi:MAG: hypothetical protein U0694_21185 [Anaerolineae bacterium]
MTVWAVFQLALVKVSGDGAVVHVGRPGVSVIVTSTAGCVFRTMV